MKQATDITVLLDRSGSMSSIANDMEGSFRSFIAEQRKGADEAHVSLYQFSTAVEEVYVRRPINEAPPLHIMPSGGTSLHDAMVSVINRTGARLAALPEWERPSRVVFITITDGEENSSRNYRAYDVKKLVEQQSNQYSWQFVYLGCNQNAFAVGEAMGISQFNNISYDCNSRGISNVFTSLSSNLCSYRSCVAENVSFSKADYMAQDASKDVVAP